MKRIIAIGDIHGEFDLLTKLIIKLKDNYDLHNHQIVFLGDYIDRGEKSFEAINYLIALKKEFPNTIFLKGNHEDMMFNYLDKISKEDERLFLYNGGMSTIASYAEYGLKFRWDSIPKNHIKFYKSLKMFYETEDYFFVHAGINPCFKDDQNSFLWIRKEFINSNKDFGKMVIFGHTINEEPVVQKNKIGIDTGAYYYGKLTAVILPQIDFVYSTNGDI